MAQQNKVDGIIGLTYNPDLSVHKNTPFVSIDRCMEPGIPCVASDNFAGGQLAAEKLADFGCKNVAFLCKSSSISNEPNKRKAGFENGCLARGLHCKMKIVGDNEPYDTFEQFLADHAPGGKMSLDGIFCVTDGLAYFILKMLRRLGVDVPRDIQLIGYDGIRFFGDPDYICSTIVQPVPDIAELCVRLLLDKSIREKPSLLCLPVTYAYGGTTREDA